MKEVLSSEANVKLVLAAMREEFYIRAWSPVRVLVCPKAFGVGERRVIGFIQVSVTEGGRGTCRVLGRVKTKLGQGGVGY